MERGANTDTDRAKERLRERGGPGVLHRREGKGTNKQKEER